MSTAELVSAGAKTISQAVEFTGIGRTEMYRLMNEGEVAYLKHGDRRLIPVTELRRILAERLVSVGPAAEATAPRSKKNGAAR